MRPLIAAEPMLRAPSPEIVSESTRTAGVCCCAISSRRRMLMLARSWTLEPHVVERHVGLDLVVGDLPAISAARAFRPGLGRERQIDAVHLLVVAERGLELLRRPPDHALGVDADRHVVLGIEIEEADVPVRSRDLELVGVAPLDLLDALVLDAIALRLIVDERAVEIGVVENAVHLVFTERLGITLPLPRLDLPAVVAVVGVDAGHALNRELLAHGVGPLVLLNDRGLESAATCILPAAAQRLQRLHAFHAAACPDVFGDETVGRLRGSGGGGRLGEGWWRQAREKAGNCPAHPDTSTKAGRRNVAAGRPAP